MYKDEQEDKTDDGNEVVIELDDNLERASVELNPFVIKLSDVTTNPNVDTEGELVLNENPIFEYVLSSSTNASDNEEILTKKLNKTMTSHIPVHSGLPSSLIKDPNNAMLIMQPKHNQPPIGFGKSPTKQKPNLSSTDDKLGVP